MKYVVTVSAQDGGKKDASWYRRQWVVTADNMTQARSKAKSGKDFKVIIRGVKRFGK